VKFETLDDFGAQGLNLDADPASGDGAFVFQSVRDRLYCFGWNGKADADRTACRRKYRTVHANYFATDIEGRSTGIALIGRRIDLNEVIVGTKDVMRAGRDNSSRHRSAKSKWVADGKDPLADPGRLVGYSGGQEFVSALDLEQREICLRIGADQLRGVDVAVVGGDFNFFAALVGLALAGSRDGSATAPAISTPVAPPMIAVVE
jgi:hypothetical protein